MQLEYKWEKLELSRPIRPTVAATKAVNGVHIPSRTALAVNAATNGHSASNGNSSPASSSDSEIEK